MNEGSEGLDRFLEAQASVYGHVLAELSGAAKLSHWMWFIFPQLKGLGHTSTSRFYGIDSKAEVTYYRHGGIVKYMLRRRLAPQGHADQAAAKGTQ